MTPFCNDVDLLHWEPNILRDAAFAAQTLLSGNGDLAGAVFELPGSPSISFADAHVQSNQIVYLGAPFDGSYPIVKIDTPTHLTISVMYDGLFPEDDEGESAPVGSATSVPFSIRTFWPQRQIVSELLVQAAGLSTEQAGAILNPGALKRACTLGTLQMIYSAIAAVADEPADFSVRADLYERLYRRALRSATVEIDLDSDGLPESRRALNVLKLQRT